MAAGRVPDLSPAADGVTSRVFLLTPSAGLGGGIERYAETLEWAFAAEGVECRRVDLRRAGVTAHARMLAEARMMLRGTGAPTRLVVVHPALLPTACLLARAHRVCGISVVCHGGDVWGAHHRPRRYLERQLMRRPGVRTVAVSSFTAGALSAGGPAAVLTPGLSEGWFQTLVDAAAVAQPRSPEVHLVTAFRLADWRSKGLPQLLDAVATLGRSDIRVTVCGSGDPPPALRRLVGEHACCGLRAGLTDGELAQQLAAADLVVLATRTRPGRDASGEGFGLVLLEAQVAGTPVVAPAYGGSHDAFVDRVTGAAPADETAEALARLLGELLKDPERLERMGKCAAEWARGCFAPDLYAARAVERLL
jgi:phosphatidylinositol alpha-1,6-mannosyltransferase